MKHFFYFRLALTNIKKNAKIYFPYLLTSTFTVMMFYVIHSLSVNTSLVESSKTAPIVLQLGTWVVVIFSVIFLFYINSFLIKRRKKEIALYNILGLEKKHMMIMMFCETLLTTLFSLVGGILMGALFSQLMFLILVNLSHIQTVISFEIPMQTIIITVLIYGIIFFIAFLFNAVQITLSNPIELLKGGQTGEKEPKTKWLITIIGLLTLGTGYFLAQTIEDPLSAMSLFFVAVILVIIGTYCLFTAGSIAILKALKKNKHFYYQTRHFTSVSQMIYRMKQNAVGLASICILCTCILVMISSTVSLYLGIQDTVQIVQNEDYKIKLLAGEESEFPSQQELDDFCHQIQEALLEQNIELKTMVSRKVYENDFIIENGQLIPGMSGKDNIYSTICAMTLDEYNRCYSKNETLADDEVLLADNYYHLKDQIDLNGQTFKIKKLVDDKYFLENIYYNETCWVSLVFKDEKTLKRAIADEGSEEYCQPIQIISIDYKEQSKGKEAEQIISRIISTSSFFNNSSREHSYGYNYNSKYSMSTTFEDAYGNLFFLGLFLGLLFLMAAILIMYYKQLSEGYEDQKRFEIMQNVGMSKKEVKQTIHSQVLIFFFLPLVVAVIHMSFAFKMITKMFGYLILSGNGLFIICTGISVVVLIIIYSIVYAMTSRTYYQIVKN